MQTHPDWLFRDTVLVQGLHTYPQSSWAHWDNPGTAESQGEALQVPQKSRDSSKFNPWWLKKTSKKAPIKRSNQRRSSEGQAEAHIHEPPLSPPYMVHSFQKCSGLPASGCVMSMKDNIKTKFKQMTKWNALVLWHQRLKQMTAFSPWIQEWQRLERVHSDQGSPGCQQLAEQGSHLFISLLSPRQAIPLSWYKTLTQVLVCRGWSWQSGKIHFCCSAHLWQAPLQKWLQSFCADVADV